MALMKSHIASQISGSVAGTTFAHSSQGSYMRARSVPVNPSSDRQNLVRSIVRDLVNDWATVLSPAQRLGWNTYGRNVTRVNRLGDSIKISGQNWYVACNTPRLQATTSLTGIVTIARVDDAPTVFTRGQIGQFGAGTLDTTGGLNIPFNASDQPWANINGGYLLAYMGKPQNASRNFFRGPWRLAAASIGAEGLPPASIDIDAATLQAAYPFSVSQNVWFRLTALYPDGRFSAAVQVGPINVTEVTP